MEFSLDTRAASLGIGEFAGFTVGPRDSGDGQQGVWRAQLGTHWHQQLRAQVTSEKIPAEFEVAIAGQIAHRGWVLTLTGRIDQVLTSEGGGVLLREIKTVTRPLPADERELRADYPAYFAQLGTYVALRRMADPTVKIRGELMFVEAGSGLAQSVAFTEGDEAAFRAQLERVVEFLDLRWRARERLRALRFRPAFAALRPGQESIQADLHAALARHRFLFLEAPTGFGKTGVLLEFALTHLRAGRFERVLYLTGKSTGQLQVARQLAGMTTVETGDAGSGVAVWQVRNKREHCINDTFLCVREHCRHLADLETRWPASGLARFYLFENEAHDLESLRAAGRASTVCPYEITRAALAFQDVWIGDYNYVFSPGSRGLFYEQPGFDPARTLLLIDEAHNLPARVADAHSHVLSGHDARALLAELDHVRAPAPLVRAWEELTELLLALEPSESIDPDAEADLGELLDRIAAALAYQAIDYAELGPRFSELLWQAQALAEWMRDATLKKLLWVPQAGELRFTCIDAAEVIGETLQAYGGVVFSSATAGPMDIFEEAVGFAKIETSSAATSREASGLFPHQIERVAASTPWRDGAYDVAVDLRVDTTYQQRGRHYATTAATIEALHAASAARIPVESKISRAVAVFFPSYRYAESIQQALDASGSTLRVALQPRSADLAAQAAWVEESLVLADVLFLVLGSSFAEGIDLLGGRIQSAMVVGPALPEVNAVQKARLAALVHLGRDAAFRRVYQMPGIQKVNQALGRLVRGPGQSARVLLHCRRFGEPGYASLLAREYQFGQLLATDGELAQWLGAPRRELP